MKEKFKIKLQKLNKIIENAISKKTFSTEMVFFIGLFIIVFTNFLINFYLGMYFMGIMFIVYSIFLYRLQGGGERKK